MTGTIFPYGRFECDISVSYGSVIGFGRISIKENEAEKSSFSTCSSKNTLKQTAGQRSFYPRLQETIVYTIAIQSVVGKHQLLPMPMDLWPSRDSTRSPHAQPTRESNA